MKFYILGNINEKTIQQIERGEFNNINGAKLKQIRISNIVNSKNGHFITRLYQFCYSGSRKSFEMTKEALKEHTIVDKGWK